MGLDGVIRKVCGCPVSFFPLILTSSIVLWQGFAGDAVVVVVEVVDVAATLGDAMVVAGLGFGLGVEVGAVVQVGVTFAGARSDLGGRGGWYGGVGGGRWYEGVGRGGWEGSVGGRGVIAGNDGEVVVDGGGEVEGDEWWSGDDGAGQEEGKECDEAGYGWEYFCVHLVFLILP